PYVALCEKLVSQHPHGGPTKALLLNTGAEAVENAVKIARQATGRPAVICYTEGIHGRTLLGMTLTSKTGYKKGSGPFAPEVYRLRFPNRFLYGDGLSEEAFVRRELERLEGAFTSVVEAAQVAAVLIEPIQGEGGFVPAPVGYLQGLRRICDAHGILLIADEVQSGFCRTGTWASYEHYGVVPDLSTWAKSMGGGLPIAAVLGKAEVMDKVAPGTVGGTYGGNPVACAAALAAIATMEAKDLNARARAIGDQVRSRFEALRATVPAIGDVRGLGAMIGVELAHDGDASRPAAAEVAKVIERAAARGVLAIPAGTRGNVIRVLSPLVITDEQLDRGLTVLEEEIAAAFGSGAARPRLARA
ncbi:MAG: aspartate aminotransferase family protein, partial [Gemmatimonadales bacterium]